MQHTSREHSVSVAFAAVALAADGWRRRSHRHQPLVRRGGGVRRGPCADLLCACICALCCAAGKRRYDRKQAGFGGQTKPVFHKKVRRGGAAAVVAALRGRQLGRNRSSERPQSGDSGAATAAVAEDAGSWAGAAGTWSS